MAGRAPSGWHREDIKAELRKRYGSIQALSRAWGFNQAAISHTLARADYSTTIERRIAEALGKPPHTIWPDRWNPNGTPRHRPAVRPNPSRTPASPHRQKRAAR